MKRILVGFLLVLIPIGAMAETVTYLPAPGSTQAAEALRSGLERRLQGGTAVLRQSGRSHEATISQSGSGNLAIVVQRGQGHSATVTQSGDGNSYILLQVGRGGTAAVEQTGGESGVVLQVSRPDRRSRPGSSLPAPQP